MRGTKSEGFRSCRSNSALSLTKKNTEERLVGKHVAMQARCSKPCSPAAPLPPSAPLAPCQGNGPRLLPVHTGVPESLSALAFRSSAAAGRLP